MKQILWLLLLAGLIAACSNQEKMERLTTQNRDLTQANEQLKSDLQKLKKDYSKLNFLAGQLTGVKARIVTDLGDIDVKFFPEKAPLHVFAFVTRAESGFYNGTQFHRVIPGFMIQGGDPNSKDNNFNDDGTGGPLVMMPHEFNDVKHVRGILSTARVSDPKVGAGSQFFIMHGANPGLDEQYTVFGEVTSGLDVVDEIANARTFKSGQGPRDHPVKAIRIRRIEVFR